MRDDVWVYAGAGCCAAGAVVAAVLRKPFWFAAGALLGAGVVGLRLMERSKLEQSKADIVLGAPEIPQTAQPPVAAKGEPLRLGAVEYPMMHRIPDTEVHLDTMDPFIAPHFHGPLGPGYESDTRHWP